MLTHALLHYPSEMKRQILNNTTQSERKFALIVRAVSPPDSSPVNLSHPHAARLNNAAIWPNDEHRGDRASEVFLPRIASSRGEAIPLEDAEQVDGETAEQAIPKHELK